MPTVQGQLLRVGMLISVALATLMLGLLMIGEQQNFLERKVRYHIHVTRTNGLLVGSPVALTGVNIGSVSAISFPDDPAVRYIDVEIEVTRRVAPRIRRDTTASIHTQGVLGDKYVELSAGSLTEPPRDPDTVIPAVDPINYEAVLGRSGDIVTNIVELTGSLNNILQAVDRGEGLLGAIVRNTEEGEMAFGDVQQAVANIAALTAHMERMLAAVDRGEGLIGALVHDTDKAQGILADLTRAAENLDAFTERLSASQGLVIRLLEDEALGERVLSNVDIAAESLADVSSKISRGEGTLGLLVNDPTLYNEATAFVATTRKSWAFRLWRGTRNIFGGRSAAPEDERAVQPEATQAVEEPRPESALEPASERRTRHPRRRR
jgi:phospholipid/cholesterol/gamma-HCH transport system substrate-binding protein